MVICGTATASRLVPVEARKAHADVVARSNQCLNRVLVAYRARELLLHIVIFVLSTAPLPASMLVCFHGAGVLHNFCNLRFVLRQDSILR